MEDCTDVNPAKSLILRCPATGAVSSVGCQTPAACLSAGAPKMKFLIKPVAHSYRSWMYRWEQELCFRATDRVVRPFEYGLEWSERWPCFSRVPAHPTDPIEYLSRLNECNIEHSAEFFSYEPPDTYELGEDWLTFRSPVDTPYAENNVVHAKWFPARSGRGKAVVVLPHWNSK